MQLFYHHFSSGVAGRLRFADLTNHQPVCWDGVGAFIGFVLPDLVTNAAVAGRKNACWRDAVPACGPCRRTGSFGRWACLRVAAGDIRALLVMQEHRRADYQRVEGAAASNDVILTRQRGVCQHAQRDRSRTLFYLRLLTT